MSTAIKSPWLTTEEAAAYAGVHVETIRKACRAGELSHVQRRKNSPYRFRRADVDRWMNGGRVEAVDEWDW